jgi:hypothetical protein
MGYLKHLNPNRWNELVDIGMAYTLHECALDTVLYVYGVLLIWDWVSSPFSPSMVIAILFAGPVDPLYFLSVWFSSCVFSLVCLGLCIGMI